METKIKNYQEYIEVSDILKVETITNLEGQIVQIIRTPGSVGLVNTHHPEVTQSQLDQLPLPLLLREE